MSAAVKANPFPWPAGERQLTPPGRSSAEEWWKQLHPSVQKRWAPVLRAMTPEQRAEFWRHYWVLHDRLPPEDIWKSFRENQGTEFEDRLYYYWSNQLNRRPVAQVPGGGA